jgi:hypothetical protein
VLERIENAAQRRLLYRELPRARLEILKETRRYLSLREDTDTAALAVLKGGAAAAHTELLLGPDGRRLLAALAKLLPLGKSVSAAENAAVEQGLKNWAGKAIALVAPPSARALGVLIQPSAEQLTEAAGALDTARGKYAEALATWGAGFPAVYRLVDSESNTRDDLRIAVDLTQFLQEAWAASWDAAKHFRDHPEEVWTLPILVDQTVARGFAPKRDAVAGLAAEPSQIDDKAADDFDQETCFAERVAADELMRVSKDVPAIEIVNNFLQFIDLVATPAKVEVPLIALVLEILTLVAGVAELADSYVRSEPERLVSRAAFGPGRSVSSAAPYLSTIVKAVAKAIFLLPAATKA